MTRPDNPPAPAVEQHAGARFARLVEIMQTLRSPRGCAWDREQTLASLRPFILEEAYEVVDAIDHGDRAALCDELGDLLLEAVFVAQICAEAGDFTIGDAADAVSTKLVRRHPHVFGDEHGAAPRNLTPTQVKDQWERIKARERSAAPARTGLLDGIPESLPSLLRASRIGARTANVGFDWGEASEVMEKVDEELAELREALEAADPDHVEEELGDLLFTMANLARKLQIDPESSLRAANHKFTQRLRLVERRLTARGSSLQDADPDEIELEWQAVKRLPPAGDPAPDPV